MHPKDQEAKTKRKACKHKNVNIHDKDPDTCKMILNSRVICQDCKAWWDIDVKKPRRLRS